MKLIAKSFPVHKEFSMQSGAQTLDGIANYNSQPRT